MEIFKDGVEKEVFGIELFDGDANQYEATNADINCSFFFPDLHFFSSSFTSCSAAKIVRTYNLSERWRIKLVLCCWILQLFVRS